jgi:hypothetical protein
VFQAARAGTELTAGDFRNALFVAATLMAFATLWSLRLSPDAGAALARKT